MAIGALLLLSLATAWTAAPTPVYPGTNWSSQTPSKVGMDSAKLTTFRNYVGGRGCVVRYGYMVSTWGNQSTRADVASCCKPWFTHFLFKAIETGRLQSVDDLVDHFEPRLDALNAPGYKDRGIRWRNLATMTSCYGVAEAPGQAFDYSDYNMALYFDTLFLKVYQSSWKNVDNQVLRPLLTSPLQCQESPTFVAFGLNDRPGRLAVSVRDFARFGLLYLRQGKWQSQQLLGAGNVQMITTSPLPNSLPQTQGKPAQMIAGQRDLGGGSNQNDHFGSYSFTWWTNGVDRAGRRIWPSAPLDTYGCFGHDGIRAMIIIPSRDLVVTWNDALVNSTAMEDQAIKLLVAAVTSSGSRALNGPARVRFMIRAI